MTDTERVTYERLLSKPEELLTPEEINLLEMLTIEEDAEYGYFEDD